MLYEHIERLSGPLGKELLCHSVKKKTHEHVSHEKLNFWDQRGADAARCAAVIQPFTIHLICPHSPSVWAASPWTHLSWQWWYLPVRSHLTGIHWMIQHEQWTHRTLTLPRCLYGPRRWAALASSCFGHQVLKHHYRFSSRMFFRPKNVFTNRLNVEGAVRMACQHEWPALGFDLMWGGGLWQTHLRESNIDWFRCLIPTWFK